MIRKLVIPEELGSTVEVRLLQWYKTEGEGVASGEVLLEFETDKAIVVVTAAQPGAMRRCFCNAGDWMKPGEVAAWLSDQPGEPLPGDASAPGEAMMVSFETT